MPLFGRKTTTLTPKQKAQRKYATAMRSIRARAKTSRGGRGAIGKRSAATTLRRKLGLGTAARKTRKVGRKVRGKTARTTTKARRTLTRRL